MPARDVSELPKQAPNRAPNQVPKRVNATSSPVAQQELGALESETNLRESEHRFRLLVEAVQDYAIFTLDAGGHVNSWNVGAERLKGYQAEEILGQHFSKFYPPEDIAAGKPQHELEIASREGRVEDEGWRLRKDGSEVTVSLSSGALVDSEGRLVGSVVLGEDITDRIRAEEERARLLESERASRAEAEEAREHFRFLARREDHRKGARTESGADEIIGVYVVEIAAQQQRTPLIEIGSRAEE